MLPQPNGFSPGSRSTVVSGCLTCASPNGTWGAATKGSQQRLTTAATRAFLRHSRHGMFRAALNSDSLE